MAYSPVIPRKRNPIHSHSRSRSPVSKESTVSDFSEEDECLDDSEKNSKSRNVERLSKSVHTTTYRKESTIRATSKASSRQRESVSENATKAEPFSPESAGSGSSPQLCSPVFLIMSCLLMSYAVYHFGSSPKGLNAEKPKSMPRYCNKFESLKKAFPNQDPYLWKALKFGIEGVMNQKQPKPSIYLFLYQNRNHMKKLTTDIVNIAANCFDPNLKAVTLDSSDFATNDVIKDQGVAILQYKKALKEGGVLLIADLNKVPAQAAKALHFICDNESPIVHKAIIFLTLASATDSGNPVQMAEDTLRSIWGAEMTEDVLAPLITRVTDQVLQLLPE